MADIHIHRTHGMGFAKARKTAFQWAEKAEQKLGVECTVIEGETSDVVEFKRAGVEGELVVTAESFDLTAKLGLLLGVFRQRIEEGIEENLDAVIAGAAKKPAGKTATAKPSATKGAAPRAAAKK